MPLWFFYLSNLFSWLKVLNEKVNLPFLLLRHLVHQAGPGKKEKHTRLFKFLYSGDFWLLSREINAVWKDRVLPSPALHFWEQRLIKTPFGQSETICRMSLRKLMKTVKCHYRLTPYRLLFPLQTSCIMKHTYWQAWLSNSWQAW